MSTPTFDVFIPPLLRVLAAHPAGLRAREAYDKVADDVRLSEEDRSALLPSGLQPVYQNRIGWAHDRLKRSGISESPVRGQWKLTDVGRAFAAAHPKGLEGAELEAIAFPPRDSKVRATEFSGGEEPPATMGGAGTAVSAGAPAPQSPKEQIESALAELRESVSRDLLATIGRAPPAFFEKLVLDLLLAMGYGASPADLQQVGGSGDAGIDGIVRLDRLGLEKVYVQAKRWAGNVGRPEIQGFYGALAGRRARKGVFITTSAFSSEARAYAEQVSDSMVLVNGAQLAAFMIEHRVGVLHDVVRIPRLNGDYFEDA